MTEPIAVDMPGKPAFPRSAPLPAPPVPRVDSPPAPRMDSPPKAEVPKPAAVAPTPPAIPVLGPTAPVGLLARWGKKQLVVGASAVFSLAAGIGAVRLMFPTKVEPTPTLPAQTWAAERPATPAPVPPPKPDVVPPTGGTLPPIPESPVVPVPPPVLRPTLIPPAPTAPPMIVREGSKLPPPPAMQLPPGFAPTEAPKPPPPPSLESPAVPTPSVYPAGGSEPPKPVPPPALPPLPPLPAAPGGMGTTPVTPPVTPPAAAPVIPPATPPVTPLVGPSVAPGGMGMPGVPPAPDFGPMLPTAPMAPGGPGVAAPPVTPMMPTLPPPGMGGLPPLPSTPAAPTMPMGPGVPVVPSAPPAVVPSTPPAAIPDFRPTAVVPENKTPGMLPAIDVTPKGPPPPSFDPAAGMGTPAAFTKPGGTTEVKPVGPEIAPKTGFDVDLHEPKANDSYESISLEFYNDRRFATALKAFNGNQPLTGGRMVEVPPMHILRKRFPAQTGGVVTPVGGAAILPPSAGPQWGPAGDKTDVPTRAVGAARGVYVVPPGGMTMKAVAKLTLGNEQRWGEVYDLNSHLRPDNLPAGTELKLPADARIPTPAGP